MPVPRKLVEVNRHQRMKRNRPFRDRRVKVTGRIVTMGLITLETKNRRMATQTACTRQTSRMRQEVTLMRDRVPRRQSFVNGKQDRGMVHIHTRRPR